MKTENDRIDKKIKDLDEQVGNQVPGPDKFRNGPKRPWPGRADTCVAVGKEEKKVPRRDCVNFEI